MKLGALVSSSAVASWLLLCACEPRTLRNMRRLYTLDASHSDCSTLHISMLAGQSLCCAAYLADSFVVAAVAVLGKLRQVLLLGTAHNDAC
jgi:hypothetical protein